MMTPALKYPLWIPPADKLTQYRKREQAKRADKPQYADNVRKLTVVREIPVRPAAEDFIVKYEYLGTLGASTRAAYGLFMPNGELLGVECFGVPPGDRLKYRLHPEDPTRVICLERGACVPWAPDHASQLAITRAIEQAYQTYGWEAVIAYADENAGEIGNVYKADSRWIYLGRDVGRGGQPYRAAVIRPGESTPVQTRAHRKAGLRTRKEAIAAGWQFVLEPTKHVFARFIGPSAADLRRRAIAQFGMRAFPTRERIAS
jgi:hypothetical protein